MADNSPILIGRDNTANPGAQTLLKRDENSTSNDPVFTVRTPVGGDGIHAEASGTSTGVQGTSASGAGVRGISTNGTGVFGESTIVVDEGSSSDSIGVHGKSTSGIGVFAEGRAAGVHAVSPSPFGRGVLASSDFGTAVYAESQEGGLGVQAKSSRGTGVFAEGKPAGRFNGEVVVDGDLTVINGNKPFKIDHPLDPQNKYLFHNSVEAPERKNVYDGVVQLDENGGAWVDLPEWLEALNGDFRYQLSAVGVAMPNLHVAEEVSENRFKIAGGEEGMKVCWQLTGTRKDPWAAANPFEVEQEKPQEERGRYLDPSLYDAPEEQKVPMLQAPSTSPTGEEAE